MKLAIVPARGGSKRIPRKNIRPFAGKPIIAYSLEIARSSGLFDRIVVSTDDDEIADIARIFGAETPFRRPSNLSDDEASTDAVLLHAIAECERAYGSSRYGCCIYPTAPLLEAADLRRGFDLLVQYSATSAFPVVKYDFPIDQAFVLDGARPRARWPQKLDARSQELADHFHDAGMFYWFDVRKFVAERKLLGDDSVAFPLPPERCQDINTDEDWARAERKYRLAAMSSQR